MNAIIKLNFNWNFCIADECQSHMLNDAFQVTSLECEQKLNSAHNHNVISIMSCGDFIQSVNKNSNSIETKSQCQIGKKRILKRFSSSRRSSDMISSTQKTGFQMIKKIDTHTTRSSLNLFIV